MRLASEQLSLSKKVDIVEKGDRSRSAIAEEFCIARSTVTFLYSMRKDIREHGEAFDSSKFCSTRKRLRLAKYSDIEDALLLWFNQARCMNVPVSGTILQVKAQELALALGHRDFRCSSGWLERFKSRHSIVKCAASLLLSLPK